MGALCCQSFGFIRCLVSEYEVLNFLRSQEKDIFILKTPCMYMALHWILEHYTSLTMYLKAYCLDILYYRVSPKKLDTLQDAVYGDFEGL